MLRNSFHLIGLLSTFMAGTQANLMRLSSKDCVLGPYCTFIRANTPLKEMQNATKKVSSFRIAPLPEQYRIPLNSTPVMLQWREKSVVKQNNCYNFATKMISNTFARPGRPIPHHFPQEKLDQCSHIVEAIQSDGFPQVSKEEVGDYSGDKVRCSYFASVITAADAPLYGRDFHFYRYVHSPGILISSMTF